MFELYTSKLNKDYDHLLQKAKKHVHYTDKIWYYPSIVGHDPLERFMKYLTIEIPLSNLQYTNHCIRCTIIETLDEAGIEARHIMAINGHQSEITIHQYSRKCPKKKIREMVDLLAEPLAKKPKSPPTSTVSVPTSDSIMADITNKTDNSRNQNIQLQPVDMNDTDDDLLVQIPDTLTNQQNDQQTVSVATTVPNTVPIQNTVNHTITNNFTTNPQRILGFLLKMLFPNSNVTINYNFNTFNKLKCEQ